MSLPILALVVLAVLALGYRFYGRRFARALEFDDARPTPAVLRADGVDYVPTRRFYLMGQHFSAIAAAGPIAGPILACQQFGWLPCVLWTTIGVVLIGAIHDLASLYGSVRHRAASMAEIAREHMGRRAWMGLVAFVWIALVYVIIAFTDITASTFVGMTDELRGAPFNPGGAVAAASVFYLTLSVGLGLVQRLWNPPLWLATAIFVPATLGAVWLGTQVSTWLVFDVAQPARLWGILILGYCFVASIVPMWALLQPRGYLGGFVLYMALAVGLVGVFSGQFPVQQPAFKGWHAAGAGGAAVPLWPFLFVTIACGACSGFHGLVCSGTTSKQIRRESDCRSVGYGSMLLESVVALVALSTIMIVAQSDVTGSPGRIYGDGIGRYMALVVGEEHLLFCITFGAMAFSTFVFDTLDVSTRLGRYLVQELFRSHGRLWAAVATLITLVPPLVILGTAAAPAPGRRPAYMDYWTLFGTSNQLLAALSLLGVTVWFYRTRRPVWYTLAPTLFVLAVTVWSLVLQARASLRQVATRGLGFDPVSINGIVSLVLCGLAVGLVVEACRVTMRWRAARGGRAAVAAAVALVVLGWLAPQPAAAQVSHNMTKVSQYHPGTGYASCWGYSAPGGEELALLGADTGTYIVDLTTPQTPVGVVHIPGPVSQWREMKTYGQYAYIVTEALTAGLGLQIVDLAASPPQLVNTYVGSFNRSHTITIDGPWAYCNGTRLNGASTGVKILSLANPVNPVEVGTWSDYYAHDVLVRGNRMWAACINDRILAVVDITDRANPVTLVTFTWTGNFTHNCDLTADGKYLLTTDENTGGNLHIFDVSDLGNIRQVAEWTANSNAIIHNVHLEGDLAHVAYYTEGTRIVDMSLPTRPMEIAYYDTWPGVSGGFNGNWEAYPYADNGLIYSSDRTTGLYVLQYDAPGKVAGVVRDATNAAPLANAQVTLMGSGGGVSYANETGDYRLFGVGAHTVVTQVFGYAPDSAQVQFVAATTAARDVVLSRLPGSRVTGIVRDAMTQAPLAGTRVTLLGTPLVAATGAGGEFEWPAVPTGVYQVRAVRGGHVPVEQTVTVTAHDPLDPVEIVLDLPPATLVWDFESGAQGFALVQPSDGAVAGHWVWSDPVGSGVGGIQPEDDHTAAPGIRCFVTGNAPKVGDPFGTADVDGGRTILLGPTFDATVVASPMLRYWRWFSNDAGPNGGSDSLYVQLSNNNGATWVNIETVRVTNAAWTEVTVPIATYRTPTTTMRLRFTVADRGNDSTVEAAIDDISMFGATSGATDVAAPARVTRLLPNVPNPFNPTTRLRFELETAGATQLRVFDVRGRLVRALVNGWQPAGAQERVWNGRDERGHAVASGAYFVRLEHGDRTLSQRVMLVR